MVSKSMTLVATIDEIYLINHIPLEWLIASTPRTRGVTNLTLEGGYL